MTLLQHEALREALTARELADRLVVTPLLDPAQIGEASIDLRLGTDFLVLRRTVRAGFDIAAGGTRAEIDSLYERVVVPLAGELWIHPRQFILGATLEFVRLPASLGGYVLGRSSWGRLGLLVATAVMVQPGFAGCLTLELVNEGESPIRLAPGLRVAQLAVHALRSSNRMKGPRFRR